MNLNQYIERIDPKSAKPVAGAIEPHELLGSAKRRYAYRYRDSSIDAAQAERTMQALRIEAAAALSRATRLSVLVTGGTGFVGKEILQQAARDADVARLVVLIRPKGELTVEHRGAELLAQLSLKAHERAKFAFVAGDVERPRLGIEPQAAEALRREITHVVHCAANVSFDDTYERSFHANVVASRHALRFSRWLQATPGSRFVAHILVGTSYLHGRCGGKPVDEEDMTFPAGGFNNYYELTKALSALEARRAALRLGLRVVELCPAIVIGDERTGNNRGDTKVVNAPVNFLGRTKGWLEEQRGAAWGALAPLAARMALRVPTDADAAMNLVTVDWVGRGVLASLKKPEAVGRRIHLASDVRVSSKAMVAIIEDEMAIEVRLSSPRVHRAVVLPLACAALELLGRDKASRRLHRLGSVFAGYSESGQPVHGVANDVAILGLPRERPDMAGALRMLCRHNEWVQEFGAMREPGEVARREALWAGLIERIEQRAGRPAGRLGAGEFRDLLGAQLGVHALNGEIGVRHRTPRPQVA